uniref:Uncharacterized protein n=1 Tax=Glossina brevipalpis TaxID=37001 RepID=A0A1A9WJQ3_9MUSC
MNKTLDCESKYKHMKLQHIEQPKKSATSSINNNVLYNNIINKWMPQIIMLGTFLGVILSCYCFENSENNFHKFSETMLKFNEIIPKNENSYENDNLNYFINTSKCHIPYVNPLSPEVLKFYKPEYITGCSKEKRLINLLYNNITNRYILHIDMKAIPGYGSNTTLGDDVLRCCYQEIIRSGRGSEADNEFTGNIF